MKDGGLVVKAIEVGCLQFESKTISVFPVDHAVIETYDNDIFLFALHVGFLTFAYYPTAVQRTVACAQGLLNQNDCFQVRF